MVCDQFDSPVGQWVELVGWRVGGARTGEADLDPVNYDEPQVGSTTTMKEHRTLKL